MIYAKTCLFIPLGLARVNFFGIFFSSGLHNTTTLRRRGQVLPKWSAQATLGIFDRLNEVRFSLSRYLRQRFIAASAPLIFMYVSLSIDFKQSFSTVHAPLDFSCVSLHCVRSGVFDRLTKARI